MNLGQLLGEQKLRIWQLEDELAERNIRIVSVPCTDIRIAPATSSAPVEPVRTHAAPAPTSQKGFDRGIEQRIHACLPDHPPGKLLGEIVADLGDISGKTVSSFLCQFGDVEHTGAWRRYRYFRKAVA